MNKKVFWFDFGGVLSPSITDLFEQYEKKTGIPQKALKEAMQSIADGMKLPILALIENAVINEVEWGSKLRKKLTDSYPDLDTTYAQFEQFGKQWLENVSPNKVMVDKLKTIKKQGYRVGILTTNVIEWETYWKSLLNLDGYVDYVLDSCKEICRKPDDAFFEIAEKRAQVNSTDCILIDDLMENCIAASERGWKTIHFTDNENTLKQLNNIIIQNNLFNKYYLSDIPNYEPKPGYEIVKHEDPSSPEIIKLTSGHEAYHIVKYDDVKKVLSDRTCIRSPSNEPGGPSVLPTSTPKELLLNLDFPDHTRLRQFVSKDFSASRLKHLEHEISDRTTHYVTVMRSKKDGWDIFKDVLDNVSAEVNCSLLGLPIEDKEYFRPLSHTVQIANKNDVENLVDKYTQLYNYVLEHVQNKRKHDRKGLIHLFIERRNQTTPPLNDAELTALLLGIVIGGDQNLLTAMTKIIYGILSLPNYWKNLSNNKSIVPDVVEEMLRLTNLGSISSFPRITTKEILLSTGKIPEGSVIYADVTLANRDPNVFLEPLKIDPFRINKRHLQFGYGMHNCMGQEMARLEICVVIDTLLTLLPELKLDPKFIEDISWDEGVVLRRPNKLPVLI